MMNLNLEKLCRIEKVVETFFCDLGVSVVDEVEDGLQLVGEGLTKHDHRMRARVVNEQFLEIRTGNGLNKNKI